VQGSRKLGNTPHVATKKQHLAIDGRTKRHASYETSLKVRKRIEEAIGWIKTVGGLAKTKLKGQVKLTKQALMCFAADVSPKWAHCRETGLERGCKSREMRSGATQKRHGRRQCCFGKHYFNGLLMLLIGLNYGNLGHRFG